MIQNTQVKKLYPKFSSDAWGMKFFFDDNDTHYTIRFAGNPIILLESLYTMKGGRNFMLEYSRAKDGQPLDNEPLMRSCVEKIDEFMQIIEHTYQSNLSPFVVYVNSLNTYR